MEFLRRARRSCRPRRDFHSGCADTPSLEKAALFSSNVRSVLIVSATESVPSPRKDLRVASQRRFNTRMNPKPILIAIVAITSFALISPAFADTDTSQMTGTVISATSSLITIQSGKDVWEIKRTDTTKVTSGELQPGSTVTISYRQIDGHKQESPSG